MLTRRRTDVGRALESLARLELQNSEILTSLKQINGRFDETLSLEGLKSQSAARSFEEIQQVVTDGIILEILHIGNPRLHELRKGETGTCEWIMTKPALVFEKEPYLKRSFPDWLQSGDGIFHITGKPGSGKSTLMKYLCGGRTEITRPLLEKWSGKKQLLLAKFFFWKAGTTQHEKTLEGLIQSLLYQILTAVPNLSRYLFSDCRTELVDGLQKRPGAQLSSDEIAAAFLRLVEASGEPNIQDLLGDFRICFFYRRAGRV